MIDGGPCGVFVIHDTDLALVSLHWLQARRIIPGQKVHASILSANAYKPQATLGEGFDIPIIHSGLEQAKLDDKFWETGLFDDTAAKELVKHLGSEQGVAPIYLDRLLFMLRFGKFSCLLDPPNHPLRLQRKENNACGTWTIGNNSLRPSSTIAIVQRSSGLLPSLPITKLVSPMCLTRGVWRVIFRRSLRSRGTPEEPCLISHWTFEGDI